MRTRALSFVDMAAIAIILLNLIDGAATILWVHGGLASEANPLMAEVLDHSPVTFMVAKLLLVSLGMFLLFRLKRPGLQTVALTACLATYTWVFLHHLQEVPVLLG